MPGIVRLLGDQSGSERLPFDLRGALLAYLAYQEGWVSREQVAFLFWPDTDEAGARRNLRQLLNRTKTLELNPPLEVDASRLRWPVECDVALVRRAVGSQRWEDVVALYGGELLAGRPLEANAGFAAWLELERENLRNVHDRARSHLAEELESRGDHAGAAAVLEPLMQSDTLAEDVLQAYMRNAYLGGQRQRAVEAYDRFARLLQAEMQLEPLPETQELARTVRSATSLGGAPARSTRRTPLQVQRPPQLVGRSTAVARVRTATTPLVFLSGEAGVGKSRLMEELATATPGARCVEGLQAVPFQAVAELVRGALKGGWDPAQLGDYREDLARLVPEAQPGVPAPPPEPLTARSRLLEAVCRCLEDAFEPTGEGEAPFAVTLDDLQWADADTLELLTLLAHRGNLRVLGAYRRYEVSAELERVITGLKTAGLLTVVELEPLDEEQVRQLLASMIGADRGPERFARWLHSASAGNVMFALETLRAMFEGGLLAEDPTGWHSELDAITRDYSELEVPSAISEVILRRLSRLSQEGVRTAQAAAVLGARFTPDQLAAMLGTAEIAVQDALEELERSGLVAGGQFRHDLLRQSVYRSLASGRQALLHTRAAEVLAPQRGAAFAAERWIVVAEHLLAAGRSVAAARAFGRAANDLQDLGLVGQAKDLLQTARARVEAGVADRTEAEGELAQAPALLDVGLAHCLIEHGELEPASQLLNEALAAATTPELHGSVLGARARLMLRTGQVEQARDDARRAVELARVNADRLMELNASSLWAEAEFHLGDLEAAEGIVAANVAALRQERLPIALAAQLASLGAILDALERHAEALPVHLEALELARSLGARHQLVNVALNLVECYRELNRPEDALAVAAEALTLGEIDGVGVLRNNVASLLVALDRLAEAEEHSLANVQVADPTLRTLAWARLTRIYHELGDGGRLNDALTNVVEHAPLTEYPVARVSAAAHLLDYGEELHLRAALELVADLDADALPRSMAADVLRVREAAADARPAP